MYKAGKLRQGILLLILVVLLCGCEAQKPEPTEPSATETTAPEVTETMEATLETTMPPETTAPAVPQTTIPEEVPEETQSAEETSEATEAPAEVLAEVPQKVGNLMNVQPTDFVDVTLYIPDIYIDLRYAGENNFTGQRIYDFYDAYLRYGTVQKLEKVCRELAQQGLYLKIWDAFRPTSAQFQLWEVFPDDDYVADPNRGFSSHSRGNTLDVTLVDAWGNELEMPTEFDDFSDAANRDYSRCSEEARKNAKLLETVMEKHGFHGYWGEWWHFSDQIKYDVETVFDPNVIAVRYPDCNEYITLREKPSGYSDALDRIPLGQPFMALGYTEQFVMAEYRGQRGYVLAKYVKSSP